jgi:hypothetical protein
MEITEIKILPCASGKVNLEITIWENERFTSVVGSPFTFDTYEEVYRMIDAVRANERR